MNAVVKTCFLLDASTVVTDVIHIDSAVVTRVVCSVWGNSMYLAVAPDIL